MMTEEIIGEKLTLWKEENVYQSQIIIFEHILPKFSFYKP